MSAYAKDRRRCRHNFNYWSFGDYLAVGAGAHGKISNAAGIWRYAKPANPNQYMEAMEAGAEAGPLRNVPDADRLFEFMLNVLRLTEGFSASQFTARTGLPAKILRERLSAPIEKGLMTEKEGDFWQGDTLRKAVFERFTGRFPAGLDFTFIHNTPRMPIFSVLEALHLISSVEKDAT